MTHIINESLHPVNLPPSNSKTEVIQLSTYIPDDLMMATGRALGGWGGGGYNEEPGAELSDTWGELEK